MLGANHKDRGDFMYYNVVNAKYLGDYTLKLAFEDGKKGKIDLALLFRIQIDTHIHKYIKNCHNQLVLVHNHVGKTLPQPLLQPNKPNSTTQI